MAQILNASPQVIDLGIQDLSTSIVTPQPIQIPQHLPKAFFYAKKGSTVPTPTIGAPMLLQYGAETFDINYQWYNHATRFIIGAAGAANTQMLQRVVPDDAKAPSNIVVYADIVADTVPNYIRNSDGGLVVDAATGTYAVDTATPTITGTRIKFITEYNETGEVLGLYKSKTGTMTTSGGVASTMYPILELKAKYQGEYYNNLGFTISNLLSSDIDTRITDATKALPYKFSIVTRANPSAKYVIMPSLFGEPAVEFSFKDKAINPVTGARFDLETVFAQQWYNETDRLLPLKYDDFEGIKLYRDNLNKVLTVLMDNEKAHISATPVTWADGISASTLSWFDFSTDDQTILDSESGLIDLFTGKSSKNVNYFTVIHDDGTPTLTGKQKEVSISATTPIFLNGGSDGTLSQANFETVVTREMQKYLDANSDVMDDAVNIESVMYDSGYTVTTKKELCNFIAVRKDTAIGLSTHEDQLGEGLLPLSDQRAIAVALKTRLKLTPESAYYGTPVTRGIIVAGTGLMTDNSSRNRIPLLYSVAVKSAQFMGAGTGEWNGVYAFDRAPGNIVTELKDIQPNFIPAGIKPTLWNDGIVWAQPYDRTQYHFPAIQTVYENDTSVLNSWFTIIAAITLTKIANNAWRNFTGATDLTDAELADAIVDFVNTATSNKFDGRIVVIPEVQFTSTDKQRGYSWRLVNKLYANNMKSVMVYTTQSYRMSALGAK